MQARPIELLAGEDYHGWQLGGAVMREQHLDESNFSNACLRGAVLVETSFAYCDLSWADLSWANLRDCDLTNANLIGACLIGANLRGALLRGVRLQGADLSGANLCGAVFNWSDMRGANLSRATYDYETELPLEIRTAFTMTKVD